MKIGIAKPVGSNLASTRFRIQIPSKHCKYPYIQGKGDITIFPKHSVGLMEAANWDGPTIWDVCDDHFEDLGDYYRAMPRLVTKVTCTTEVLRDRIKKETGVDAVVITDPLEYERKPPHIGHNRLFWYGHRSNLQALMDLELYDYDVMVVTNLKEDWCFEWSHRNMRLGYDWCDAVIIPTKQTPDKQAKSPNRMTEAINAGRFVIANDIHSYRGYGMYLGDIKEGLEWLRQNPLEALDRLEKAQELVTQKHSPEVVGKQWEMLFDSIWAADSESGRGLSTSI